VARVQHLAVRNGKNVRVVANPVDVLYHNVKNKVSVYFIQAQVDTCWVCTSFFHALLQNTCILCCIGSQPGVCVPQQRMWGPKSAKGHVVCCFASAKHQCVLGKVFSHTDAFPPGCCLVENSLWVAKTEVWV
jgi:hypothetical protein